ncbi:molybdopterin-dependent oxidoreductase [Dehalococcoidia bacterium]|nr:molybdopterin-dependent oxidoreductase [Dehalococcoidia bacterium]
MTNNDQINITIDGQPLRVERTAMVLDAAISAGIYVPYLCYHPGMKPFAACRMCVVQEEVTVDVGERGHQVIEKQLRPPAASCTLRVREGMSIRTTTDSLRQLQRGIMEMLISEHPHGCLTCHRIKLCGTDDICLRHVSVNDRCVTCPKNDRCEFKDSVRFLGMDMDSPMSYKTRDLPIEISDPFYDRDYNLCIVCGRCVRVCEDIRGDNAITFTERAGQALVGTSTGVSLLQSGCEFCGACLDVCPVGALVERDHKWDKAIRVERTVCPHCPVGCQLNLEINKRDKVIRVIPEINAPANRGQACFKGKFGLEYVNHRDRLKFPMIRRNGELQKATWEEALEIISNTLPYFKGDQFAAIASARSTNESAYLLQKFSRVVMQSNNVDVDSNTRPALARTLMGSLGYAASTNPIWDLVESDCILAVDTNVTEEHNVVGVPIKQAIKENTKLIVIDAREVELTRHAHLWLRPRPRTTLTLLAGILQSILDQKLEAQTFINDQCQGLEELRISLSLYTLEYVSRVTGVSQDLIENVARVYSSATTGAIIYALDNVPQQEQASHVEAIANLALVTGNIGAKSTGLYALRHGTNEQGANDVGCGPDVLPGYQMVDNDAARQGIETRWGTPVPANIGLDLTGALNAAKTGRVKAMLLLGDSINYSNTELANGYEAFNHLDFLVVQDVFLSEVSQQAHVVLPCTTFVEEDGTYTNLERRVQLLKNSIAPKNSSALPAWHFLCRLAQTMGAKGFHFETTAEVFDEIATVAPIYGGISHDRLLREGVMAWRSDHSNPQPTQLLHSDRVSQGIQWPCENTNTAGTSTLYKDGFPYGRAKLVPIGIPPATQQSQLDFPLLLSPGRVLAQQGRDTQVVRINDVNCIQREELIEIHPWDAADLAIADKEAVDVVSNRWHIRAIASLSSDVQQGVVSITTLFGGLAARLQASEDPDPMAKTPGLVTESVRVEKLT